MSHFATTSSRRRRSAGRPGPRESCRRCSGQTGTSQPDRSASGAHGSISAWLRSKTSRKDWRINRIAVSSRPIALPTLFRSGFRFVTSSCTGTPLLRWCRRGTIERRCALNFSRRSTHGRLLTESTPFRCSSMATMTSCSESGRDGGRLRSTSRPGGSGAMVRTFFSSTTQICTRISRAKCGAWPDSSTLTFRRIRGQPLLTGLCLTRCANKPERVRAWTAASLVGPPHSSTRAATDAVTNC